MNIPQCNPEDSSKMPFCVSYKMETAPDWYRLRPVIGIRLKLIGHSNSTTGIITIKYPENL